MTVSPSRVDYQKVIRKAEEFFRKTGIPKTVPIEVEKAAINLGVRILRKPLEGDVSGFLFLDRSNEPLLGLNAKHRSPRQRFTIAHELGHLFLHAPKVNAASFIDKSFFIINRDQHSSKGIEPEEIEANFFAAEILMPGDLLYKDLAASSRGVNANELYKMLARKFQVSDEAMRFRLNSLGFIKFQR